MIILLSVCIVALSSWMWSYFVYDSDSFYVIESNDAIRFLEWGLISFAIFTMFISICLESTKKYREYKKIRSV